MSKIAYIGKDLIEKGEDFVLAKVVDTTGSTPRKKGACLLMKKDGTAYGTVGGGKLEAETEIIALEAFKTKESKIHHFRLKPEEQQGLDMRCGGDADIAIEYVEAAKPETFEMDFNVKSKALIFGGGHVGLALEPILRYIGFTTTVIDDRRDYANHSRFPEADEIVVVDSFLDAYNEKQTGKSIETDGDTYVIIVTRGHSGDYDVLKQTLDREIAYIGMIGSRGKVAELYKMLRADGYSQEVLDSVYSPIGLKIFAETPEEIAISVAAEMIKVRAGHGKETEQKKEEK